ncbi:hypothetical protein BC629DRAFT_1457786 [Irpex lacteus]|nr:hypothetical protein BC629DRAFT_1457786 [Irpex lacteus]
MSSCSIISMRSGSGGICREKEYLIFRATTPQSGHDYVSNQTPVDRPLERSTVVWFDDGSCVLQAENRLFKMYSGLLAKYSNHFRTMLSLPQPAAKSNATESDQQQMYENCPLIPMFGDSAKDVEHFLHALTDLHLYADVTKVKDVEVVLAVINMSLKYDADILLHRSLPAFTAFYPATLPRWYIRSQRRQYAAFTKVYGRALPYVVIAIAKKTGMDVLLPPAMFECCSYSIDDIMKGVAKPDGEYVHLDHDSQRAILNARVQLSNSARETKAKILHDVRLSRTDRRRSIPYSDMAVQDSWTALTSWANTLDGPDWWVDPLKTAEGWPEYSYAVATQGVVNDAQVIGHKLRSNNQQVWKKLPEAFGLQEWDKLRRSWIH